MDVPIDRNIVQYLAIQIEKLSNNAGIRNKVIWYGILMPTSRSAVARHTRKALVTVCKLLYFQTDTMTRVFPMITTIITIISMMT